MFLSILQVSSGIWEPYTPNMVADPKNTMQWEWPEDDFPDEKTWARLTKPIKEVRPTFGSFLKKEKSKTKVEIERKKKKIYNQQTPRNQLNRILRILNQLGYIN